MAGDRPRLSVVTPAYNEAESLLALHGRLLAVLPATGMACEWIVVDDHSVDATFAVVAALARTDARVRGIRLARRCGSHAAIRRGVLEARGEAVAFLAADLQDPPEVLIPLLAEWRAGAPVVWAVRRSGNAEGGARDAAPWSRLYHRLLHAVGSVRGLPADGAGCFLIDRGVVETMRRRRHRPADVMALIGSLGYPFATVAYDRPPRLHGRSRWTLNRKVTFALASLVSLSPLAALRAPRDCPIEARVQDVTGA